MKKTLILALTLALAGSGHAAEGMWTLDNVPVAAMQKELGWAPDAAWLDKAMRGSARLAFGCSASFVSKEGLVLTNHHCVESCVAQLSTGGRDLMQRGFLARRESDELRCPAMEINRLEQISDVTQDLMQATAGLDGTAFKSAQNAAKARLASACVGTEGRRVRCDVVSLYRGGQYKLYRYRRFQDVRLAFAPEQAIAFFGGDPDNFNYPRFDLDMALLRVWDGGKPLPTPDHFTLSATGPAAGDAVFVLGHPGSTERELTVSQLTSLRDRVMLDRLLRLAEYRGVLTAYRATGTEPARTALPELFGVENGFKASFGQMQTLLDPRLFATKRAEEAELRRYVASQPQLAGSAGAWDAIAAATTAFNALYQPSEQIERGRAFSSSYFAFARTLVRAAAERTKPDGERLPEFNDSRLPQVEASLFSSAPIYPDLERVKLTFSLAKFRELLGADDPRVQRVLGKESPEQLAARLVAGTRLGDVAERQRLWNGGAAAIAASDDPFIRLAVAVDPEARDLRARFEREVDAVVEKNGELIARARFAREGTGRYPDATFSLRLSYGVVQGWDDGGRPVAPFTRIGGAFDRATGAEPYALPASWLRGKGRVDLATPLNFVTTNDIIGGNSGSPMLNRQGELVGLIFDGNIHSLGGAYGYEPERNRAVAVDSAGILEALDKIYDAKALASELRGR